MKEVIILVMIQEVDLDLKRPATLPFTIVQKVLMVMVEVDIGLKPSTLSPTIQVGLVYFCVYMFMVMIEVYIGLRLSTFLHITTLKNAVSTQASLKMLFLGYVRRKYSKHSSRMLLISTSKLYLLSLYNNSVTPFFLCPYCTSTPIHRTY